MDQSPLAAIDKVENNQVIGELGNVYPGLKACHGNRSMDK